ncbi:hypothetical protein EQ500_00760 [Lactobacillus sp. XV13L]|nr:hypothetical protein [Lactobacillus sp. XV13L]
MQDLMRAGGTYVTKQKHGFTVYLNSAIVKGIVWGGSGAVAAAVGTGLAAVGAGPAVIGAVSTVITDLASSVNTSRGIYVKFSNKGNLVSWGYQ